MLLIWTDVGWHHNGIIIDKIWDSINERIFMKFDFSILRKSGEKTQMSLKSDKNNWNLTRRPTYIFYRVSFTF
jgi:hypothetical protein